MLSTAEPDTPGVFPGSPKRLALRAVARQSLRLAGSELISPTRASATSAVGQAGGSSVTANNPDFLISNTQPAGTGPGLDVNVNQPISEVLSANIFSSSRNNVPFSKDRARKNSGLNGAAAAAHAPPYLNLETSLPRQQDPSTANLATSAPTSALRDALVGEGGTSLVASLLPPQLPTHKPGQGQPSGAEKQFAATTMDVSDPLGQRASLPPDKRLFLWAEWINGGKSGIPFSKTAIRKDAREERIPDLEERHAQSSSASPLKRFQFAARRREHRPRVSSLSSLDRHSHADDMPVLKPNNSNGLRQPVPNRASVQTGAKLDQEKTNAADVIKAPAQSRSTIITTCDLPTNSHKVTVDYLKPFYQLISGFGADYAKDVGDTSPVGSNRAHIDSSNMTYGEVTFEGMDSFYKSVHLNADDVFYDLGSGVGKLVMYVALRGVVRRSVGVEVGERRHALAEMAAETITASLQRYKLASVVSRENGGDSSSSRSQHHLKRNGSDRMAPFYRASKSNVLTDPAAAAINYYQEDLDQRSLPHSRWPNGQDLQFACSPVEFQQRDISRMSYPSDVTVVFISNLLIERNIQVRALEALLKHCPRLRLVITIVPLHHIRLKLLRAVHVGCTWARISSWQVYGVTAPTSRPTLLKTRLRA